MATTTPEATPTDDVLDPRSLLVRARNGLMARPRIPGPRRPPRSRCERSVLALLFDVQPLLDKIEADSDLQRSAILGCDPTVLARWRKTGMRIEMAEQWAERLGFFPFEIWPDYHLRIDAIYREAGE